MTNEDFVTYEIAQALKKAGFDWPCYTFWSLDFCADGTPTKIRKTSAEPKVCVVSERNSILEQMGSELITAPLMAEAQKWLRNEKGATIVIYPQIVDTPVEYSLGDEWYYSVWGCNYYDYVFAHGRIVWDKCNGASSFSDCEIAATNLFDSVRLFPFMWNGMCQGKSISDGRTMQGNKKLNEKRIHPTQKPVALYAWLLTQYAKAGWRILDTHLGSGSIAIACDNLEFELLGIEIDRHYYDAARERIINHQKQPRLDL